MARFIQPLQRTANRILSSLHSSAILTRRESLIPSSCFQFHFRTYESAALMKSPMESNLIRLLRNQIQSYFEYAPLYQTETEIGDFEVTDKAGEKKITLTGKYGENEDIRIEATTFDCSLIVPLTGEGPSKGEERHHLSMHIYISKGEGRKPLKFICSSWPEFFEVQRVYVASDLQNQLVRPYLGRYFGALDIQLQKSFYKFLGDRGIDNELSFLLHAYMKNRTKMDSFQWLQKVQSFVEQ